MKNVNKLFSCLGVTVACLAGMTQSAYAAVAGHMQFINGDVQITNPAGQTRPAQKGDAVNEGDTVISAPSASAQIKMQDGGFVAMRSDTKLKFDQFVFAGKQDGSEKGFFSLFKGGFRAVTGLIGQINKQNYRVTTPAATIGIRGTDHETFLIVPGSPLAQIAPTGAYNKVNVGETSLTTDRGTINVLPNQMGFAGGMNQAPQLQPVNTKVFTVAEAPAPQAKAEKKEEKKEEKAEAKQEQKTTKSEEKKEDKKEGGKDSKQADKGNGEAKGDTKETKQASTEPAVVTAPQEPAPLRVSVVVDAVAPSAGLIQSVTPVTVAPVTIAPVIAPPPAPTTVVPTMTVAGLAVNLATGTATTTTGQVIPVTQSLAATQAQTAAAAAAAAATAAQAAANAAALADTTLAAIVPVPVMPATASINTASPNIVTANTAVTAATALAPANAATAATNATTAQTAATTAAAQAAAAQAALTANGTLADATAAPAHATLLSANTSLQAANTAVQTAAGTVTAQNTALTTAQGAASTALTSASTNLTTANTNLTTANTQNTVIVTAQGSTATQLTAAQTAATNAQAAATAAQAAATLAAALQLAGDLVGAQAQLLIAQQQLVIAQTGQTNAQAAQAAVATQLANAQTAQTAAGTAVTSATTAATTAATDAATAQTQATAAQTASTNANAALTTSTTNLATVNTNAPVVAANAPIAAYNNPNILSLPGASHNLMADHPVTGGLLEIWDAKYGVLNTQYVLDGSKNLVEMRSAGYNTYDQMALVQGIPNANVKFVGGVAQDTYVAPDSSIYMGRWQGGGITVTDMATALVLPFTTNIGVSSAHWVIGQMVPETLGVSLVQSLVGTTNYTMSAFTRPTDSFGNVGTVTNATLTANFTAQTVASAATFTFSTADPVNSSLKNQVFAINQLAMPIINSGFNDSWPAMTTTVSCSGTNCGAGTWSAWLTGDFAGATASSAYVDYALFNRTNLVAAAGSVHTDMVRSIVAFSTTTAPAVATSPATGSYVSGFMVPVAITGGGYTTARPIHSPPLPNTSIVLAGTGGNLVKLLGTPFEEPMGISLPLVSIANANVTWSGGTAADYYHSASGNITFGRYQGGSVNVTDLAAIAPVAPFSISLAQGAGMIGPTSSVWAFGVAPANGYVQTLTGTTAYTKTGNTTPFDSLGGMGVLNSASLSANFTSQLVSAALNLTMSTGTYASDVFNVNATMPINLVTAADPSGFKTVNPGGSATVTCTVGPCTGAFSAEMRGSFVGANASDAALGYGIFATSIAAPADIINGYVAFNAATPPTVWTLTGGPFAAYVPSGVTVALSSPYWGGLGWDSFTVAQADIAGIPSSFINRWGCPGCGESATTTVLGAATPVNGVATSTATTGIQFGRWTVSTAVEHTYVAPLGTRWGAPGSWMYGPQGYLDTPTPLAGTFNYQLDGASAPYDRATGLSGTLTSATLTANFTAMTVNAALGLTMPGGQLWAATATNQSFFGNQFWANTHGGVANTLVVTRNGLACPTCGGNLAGGFTGQNYAGAILSYNLYDQATVIDGKAALTRTGVTGNPAVTNGAPVTPTSYFVAEYGASLSQANAITATGNLLTAFSSGTPGASGYSSTTVTCTTCTTAPAGDVLNSGIYFGTWQAGGWTNTWGGSIGLGQFHWITGSEAGPVYLPEVLTGTVTYALDGGTTPTNLLGTAGSLNTATLTVNFTKQVVGISLSALVAGNTWSASTAAGNEARLDYSTALGRTLFAVSSYGDYGRSGGLLTVTVSNANGTLPADGWVSGNLTGAGLTGAVLSYTLQGGAPTISPGITQWDQINGVAAFVAPASNTATPYRIVGVALTDPTSAVPLPGLGGLYNAASRVTSDVTGNLTQFDISPVGGGSAQSLTLAQGTSTLTNFGSDPITGISWGRWQGGVINVTDRATGVVTPITLQGSAHWIAGPAMTAPVTLPVSGTFAYTLAGNTVPTNNLGATGTLNSATLSANFTAQTVDVGVNATVGTTTLGASATGLPIMQGAAFGAGGNMGVPLAVTCAGTCGTAGSHGGAIAGGFTGAGATGAGMMYSLGTGLGGTGATVISGVAAFRR